MSTIPAPFGERTTNIRRLFGVKQHGRVIDLTEFRRRKSVDPLAGVRRRLRRAMAAKHMTVAGLAAESGINPVSVAEFLRGGPATPREITRLASVLGLNWSLLSGA